MARKSVVSASVQTIERIENASPAWKTTDHCNGDEWTERRKCLASYIAALPADERAVLHKVATIAHNSGINRKIFAEAISEDYKVLNPAAAPAKQDKTVKAGSFVTPEMMQENNDRMIAQLTALLSKGKSK